jgi:predicted transposase/invertase (TIGR01784 family)
MKFVDVKNDIAFRKIFGNENKSEILISFLNAVLELPKGKKIKKIEIKNPFQMPEIKGLKSSILDVRVTDEREITYIVEMQVEELEGFDKRVQFYTAKQYSSQIDKGKDYPRLNQVIFIGILDFTFFNDDDDYITRHRTVNIKTQKSTLNGMEYNFIELPKFRKELKDIKTLIDKWIYFIKNAPNLDVIPADVKDSGLKHAYEDALRHNWTKKELEDYLYAEMRQQDEIGKTEIAVKKAVKIAVEKAVKEALDTDKIDIAKKGIKAGFSNSVIQTLTGLTNEQIDGLRKPVK